MKKIVVLTIIVGTGYFCQACLPAMDTTRIGTWSFDQLKEDDLRSIYDYLMSTKPVKNLVPSAVPSVLQQL